MTVSLVEALARVAAARPAPRVTVVRAGALGDTVLILPALQLLRERMPGARITLVGSRWADALQVLLPFPLKTAHIDDPALAPLFCAPRVTDRTGLFAEADAVILYAAEPTADFVRNAMASCRGPAIVRPVASSQGTHAALHFAQAIVHGPLALGDLPLPALRTTTDLAAWAHQWMKERVGPGGRPVALHPGSGGRHKQWPPACFAALGAELGGPTVLLEGPADAEACGEVATRMSAAVPVVRAAGLPLSRVAALLSACRLYVGNDSGLSHVAAALGVPTVTVVGPTDPRMWAPLGPRTAVVRPADGAAWPAPDAVLEVAQRIEA